MTEDLKKWHRKRQNRHTEQVYKNRDRIKKLDLLWSGITLSEKEILIAYYNSWYDKTGLGKF